MGHNNLEVLKNTYANFAKGDVPAVLAVFDPKIDWTEAKGFPYGGHYIGPDEVLNNLFMKLGEEWDEWKLTLKDYIDDGNRIVALGTYSATYKETGKYMETEFAHVWTFKDGIAKHFLQYVDSVSVLEAMKK